MMRPDPSSATAGRGCGWLVSEEASRVFENELSLSLEEAKNDHAEYRPCEESNRDPCNVLPQPTEPAMVARI